MRKQLCSLVIWLVVFLISSLRLHASDWTFLKVVTNEIIVLRFDDGYIDHSGYRQASSTTITHNAPLNTALATTLASYIIYSPDDPAYSGGLNPLSVGRKSKGQDFSNNCNWVNNICDNEFVSEHFIYLRLPHPLKDGHTYVVNVGSLAENYSQVTLWYDFTQSRSVAVHANQIGFIPDAPVKYAYISHWMGDAGPLDINALEGAKFHLIDQSSQLSVFEGTINKRLDISNASQMDLPRTPDQGFLSMSDVWECDFSSFSTQGEYVLAVEGIGASYPFKIHDDIYREAYYHTTRQLYHQRSGIRLEHPYTDWSRPRNLHPDDKQIKFQYTTSKWIDWPSGAAENGIKEDVYSKVLPDYNITTWGWYMDAGDWDGYYTHLRIPRLLMTAYELKPDNFSDGELNIPESGNGIPDIIDEARFLIDYLDRTRGPSGGVAGARIHPDFETKPFDNIPSWEDVRVWTISGEDHVTTYSFAGLAAHLSHIYGMLGRADLKNQMLQKAIAAYDWAEANNGIYIPNLHNARMYAAAWLYKTTGVEAYQTAYLAGLQAPLTGRHADDNLDWAIWAYLTTDQPGINSNAKITSLSRVTQKYNNELVVTAEARSFRVGFGWNFKTFLGQATTPLVFQSLVLYHITEDEKYLTTALTSADYMLGGNPLDYTWLVGYGDENPKQVLHLDTWLHPDGRDQFIPGTIPYGPTAPGEGWPPTNGPWSNDFAWDRIYPSKEMWPLHEGFFNNRYDVPTNEYTVHQTTAPAAAVYGLLSGTSPGNFVPNQPPSVTLGVTGNLESGATVIIEAQASDPDGYVRRVEFFNGRQKIGQRESEPFTLVWENIPEGPYEIKAIAFDNEGKSSVSPPPIPKPVEEIIITNPNLVLNVGEIRRVNVTILPEDATVQTLVFILENEEIGLMRQSGLFTAHKGGQSKLTVRALDADVMAETTITVNQTILGIAPSISDYSVYPNPVQNGILNVELPDTLPFVHFVLFDLQGKVLKSGELNQNQKKQAIDLKHLNSGFYILNLNTSGRLFQFKVVIE